jgi:nitroreductase
MTNISVSTAPSVMDAIYGRRSVREFTPARPAASTIQTLLDAAVQAPTAVHEEPWIFAIVQDPDRLRRVSQRAKSIAIVQDPDRLRRVSQRAKSIWREQMAAAGPGPTGAADPKMTALRERLADPDFNIFYSATTLIVIAAKPLGPFVSADCWLAAENLMLAAYGLGLGTCCIGFALAALNTPEMKTELRFPPTSTCVAAIIVGAPARMPERVGRKSPVIASWA